MSSGAWARKQVRRREALEQIDRQVKSGELVIRWASDAERAEWARQREARDRDRKAAS